MIVRLSSRSLVILGKAPAVSGRTWDPATSSAQNLADLAGCKASKLRDLFELDNLVPYSDPSREALRDAALLYKFDKEKAYILCGTEVLRALGSRARPAIFNDMIPTEWGAWGPTALQWYQSREGYLMSFMPHPSGRNRWYNKREHRAAVVSFLREATRP